MEKVNGSLGIGPNGSSSSGSSGSKRKEIYKYEAPWTVYSMNWSVRPDKRFRLALGSFIEEYNNKVQIVTLDEENSDFYAKATFDHPYPTTKIMWIPDAKGIYPDLLATSGDYLRVWRSNESETRLECLLNNVSHCETQNCYEKNLFYSNLFKSYVSIQLIKLAVRSDVYDEELSGADEERLRLVDAGRTARASKGDVRGDVINRSRVVRLVIVFESVASEIDSSIAADHEGDLEFNKNRFRASI